MPGCGLTRPDPTRARKRGPRPSGTLTELRIDLDFDLQTVDGEVFPARGLLGRPTILVLLRYLG